MSRWSGNASTWIQPKSIIPYESSDFHINNHPIVWVNTIRNNLTLNKSYLHCTIIFTHSQTVTTGQEKITQYPSYKVNTNVWTHGHLHITPNNQATIRVTSIEVESIIILVHWCRQAYSTFCSNTLSSVAWCFRKQKSPTLRHKYHDTLLFSM